MAFVLGIMALLFTGFIFLFDGCIALNVLLFFNLFSRAHLPKRVLCKMAFFLLGPLSTLWLVRLWIPIPFFLLAQIILAIIYTQQIFNTRGNFYEN